MRNIKIDLENNREELLELALTPGDFRTISLTFGNQPSVFFRTADFVRAVDSIREFCKGTICELD
jgi:hypothetical protein